jgi:hypothetical protein
MTRSVVPSPSAAVSQEVLVRIRFVDQAPPGAKVRRVFKQPRSVVAIEDPVPAASTASGSTEYLDVIFRATPAKEPADPGASPGLALQWEGAALVWRPGRVLVQGKVDDPEPLLATLIDFAFYEGELRDLEEALQACEEGADADIERAYRIRRRDKPHWDRIAATAEYCSRTRLTYARLTPLLECGTRTLPRASRRLVAGLRRGTDIENRLETFSDRLEACEDIYEGATDRIADYRWYSSGHWLEVGILIFLLVEVAIMGAELILRIVEME